MQESGLALKRHNSTRHHTSCTCCVKFTLRIDHNSCFLVCGIGEDQHTGNLLLFIPTRYGIINVFLTFPPWKLFLQWLLPTSSPPKLLCLQKPVPVRSLLVVRWHRCKVLQEWQKTSCCWLPPMLMLPQSHLSLRPLRICWIIYKKWSLLIRLSVLQRQNKRTAWEKCQGSTNWSQFLMMYQMN